MTKPISQITDIGFKRKMNRKHPPRSGYSRSFVKCSKCGNKSYYDYIPYSLSNPVITTPCGHDFRTHYIKF